MFEYSVVLICSLFSAIMDEPIMWWLPAQMKFCCSSQKGAAAKINLDFPARLAIA